MNGAQVCSDFIASLSVIHISVSFYSVLESNLEGLDFFRMVWFFFF